MSKIYISPSNQNNNPYSYGGTNEMEQCYKIGQACNTALKRCGFTTMIADKGQAMYTSINESNKFKADVHICIHTNAGGGKGAEVMVFEKSATNLKYAQPVYNELSALTGNGRGIKVRAELAEINSTNAICVYCECEFHDNKNLAKWIVNNTTKLGEAIAKGICKGFGVTYKTSTPTAPVKPAPVKPTTTKEIYRVGTAWKNGKCENQKGAFEILANAKALCNKYVGYFVFNSKGVKVHISTKKATAKPTIKAGLKLSLKSVPLYASSSAKTKAGTVTGTYYLWDSVKVNNRYRITNSTSNVGKAGQVTGWINHTDVKV